MPRRVGVVSIVAELTRDDVASGATQILVEHCGSVTAAAVAAKLQLPSRYSLAHHLRRVGALRFVELREWVTIDRALQTLETEGLAPCTSLLRSGKDPAVLYRLARRLTGRSWSELRTLGSAWLLGRFAERCREHYPGTTRFQ